MTKVKSVALAGVAQHRPVQQRVEGLVPGQVPHL